MCKQLSRNIEEGIISVKKKKIISVKHWLGGFRNVLCAKQKWANKVNLLQILIQIFKWFYIIHVAPSLELTSAMFQ